MTDARSGPDRTIMASRFKAECLAILDQVEQMRVSIVITKHGRPIARVVPLEVGSAETTWGSVQLLAEPDEAYYSTGEAWDADTGAD